MVGEEGELPTLLRAHNEETRALKHHLRKSQGTVRQLQAGLKKKDEEVYRLQQQLLGRSTSKKSTKMNATVSLEDQVFDLKEQLKARDDDVKVYNNLSSDFWVNFLPIPPKSN